MTPSVPLAVVAWMLMGTEAAIASRAEAPRLDGPSDGPVAIVGAVVSGLVAAFGARKLIAGR